MNSYHILLIYLALTSMLAIEIPSESFEKLNTFKTIDKNDSFIINTKVKSIAYFDSFDKNSIIYISKNSEDFLTENDEKITGKFYTIEANTDYYVRNYLYSSPSVFQTYLFPLDLSNEEINIDDEVFIYLVKNKEYTLNFNENKNKKMIKLSRKTLDSKVKITKEENEIELNKNNLYYELGDFSGQLKIETFEEDAFIEFLSDYGEDNEVFEDIQKQNYETEKNNILIKIPKTNDKIFYVTLESPKEFSVSLSYGFSNKINYYYINSDFSRNSIKINKKIKFQLNFPFNNINLLENEFLSLDIKIEKDPEQILSISYLHSANFMERLVSEELDESYCKDIINNLNTLLEYYVYLDIAQNPPEIEGIPNYHHRRINLKEELNKVSTVNRKFYEFYQEIYKILTATKDLHFNVVAFASPKKLKFNEYYVCLPFYFVVQKYKGNNKLFIKPNKYINNINENQKEFIDSHADIPLKYINDMDPFDYVQNWSKFRATKNIHAQFSFIIDLIPFYYLYQFPNNISDMINEYEFEDNKILRIAYLNSVVEENKIESEFDKYYQTFVKSIKAPFIMPPMDIIKEDFLIFKGLKKKILKAEEKIINWDKEFYEGSEFIKCRVDNDNKVNVLAQNSFYLDLNDMIPLVFDCARLFYSNNYPLIIIETKNGGGYGLMAILMQQIFQIRTADRGYEQAFRLSEINKEYYKSKYSNSQFTEVNTCKTIYNFDINEITDHYNYNGLDIEHKRTNIIDLFSQNYRDAVNNFREEYKDSPNLKNPTDIIIFTDSYSYSSGSVLIQQFQATGGAILVGYYGNPKIEGIDQFDASQSYSMVETLESTETYKNIVNLGWHIYGVTTGEYFDDIHNDNPIPREYMFLPVDYRIDLYTDYSDNIYDSFITNAKEIHKKFNNDYCNSKNQKLILYSEDCDKLEEDKIIHGGYKCGSDNQWDKTKCVYNFCEIGYYYDYIYNKCIEECKYNKKAFIIHENNMDKEFIIKTNDTYEFMYYSLENYYGYMKTTQEQMGFFPKVILIPDTASVSITNNDKSDLPIRIMTINPSINPNLSIISYSIRHFEMWDIYFFKGKKIQVFQFYEDTIIYINNPLKATETSIQIAEYKEDMTPEDILSVNKNYYNECDGYILKLEQNKEYFIYLESNEYEQIDFYLAGNRKDIIEFNANAQLLLYLEKDNNFTLNTENIKKDFNLTIMIKLDRKTINSEIFIKEKNITLNSNNLYYELNDASINESINLEVKNDNALIKILLKMDEEKTDIIELKENDSSYTLLKRNNFIKIPKEYSSKIINFEVEDGKNSLFFVEPAYTIAPYCLYHSLKNGNNNMPMSNFTFNITEHYKDNVTLMEDEYYYVIVQTTRKGLTFNVKLIDIDEEIIPEEEEEEEEGSGSSDNTDNDEGHNKDENEPNNTLYIIIIVSAVCGVIIILIIILIILKGRRKKKFDELQREINNIDQNKDKEVRLVDLNN